MHLPQQVAYAYAYDTLAAGVLYLKLSVRWTTNGKVPLKDVILHVQRAFVSRDKWLSQPTKTSV